MPRAASSLRASMMVALTLAGRMPISMQSGLGTSLASLGSIWRAIAAECSGHGELIRRSLAICADAAGVLPTAAAVVVLLWTLRAGDRKPGNTPKSLIVLMLWGAALIGIRAALRAW